MLLNTTITVKCGLHRSSTVESLQSLMGILAPAAEQLEEELRGRQDMDVLELNDRVLWELDLEGPDPGYLAQGCVSHLRGGCHLDSRTFIIQGGALEWRDY